MDEAAFAAYEASFALTDDETATAALAAFEAARVEYVAALPTPVRSATTRWSTGSSSTRFRLNRPLDDRFRSS